MWSMGCILAEMLICTQMSRNSDDRIFFKGTSCYPQTPEKKVVGFSDSKNEISPLKSAFLTFTDKQAEYEKNEKIEENKNQE